MIVADEIFQRLFIWGVVAVAVIPRQHIDHTRCSIGGSLSTSFKKLLLALVAVNFVRLLMLQDNIFKNEALFLIRDFLGIVQQLGNSFICFLSPYILQTWLADTINLGGRPGANLMPALYASTLLSILASILSKTWHVNFWALRKLGNAISSPPVMSTLKIFNSVTTRGGAHEGRGTILSQSLMTVEYWYVIVQVLSVVGFAMNRGKQDETTQLDELWSAFRKASFVLDWTRVLAHSLFINQLDELFLTSSPSQSNDGAGPNSCDTEMEVTEMSDDTDLVPFIVR